MDPEFRDAELGLQRASPVLSRLCLQQGTRGWGLGAEAQREGRARSGKSARRASICPDSQQLHRVIVRLLQMHLLQGLEAGDLFTGKSILITGLSLA